MFFMDSDDETEGFSFIWTVQNLSYCLEKKGESLVSPRFKINMSDTDEWCLRIFPRGYDHHDRLWVCLCIRSDGPFPIKVDTLVSIRTADGTFMKKEYSHPTLIFENECGLQIEGFSTPELFVMRDVYIKNDTLTLRCRMRKRYPQFPDSLLCEWSGQCHALTVIDVKRIAFEWAILNFGVLFHTDERKSIDFHSVSSENQSFTVAIFFSGKIHNKKNVQLEIKQNPPYQKCFVSCKLSLVNNDGKHAHTVHSDHLFEDSQETRTWNFRFLPVEKILGSERPYMDFCIKSLHCEFAVSSGVKYNEVESIKYGIIEKHEKALPIETSSLGSWKDNMKSFYEGGKFSDFVIHTASGKEFPVHKAILCAQSDVFAAMFDHDMKEKRTGVAEIEDLKDDVVSKMLMFAYTDSVEDLNWEGATDLCFAADKYGMTALKRHCSAFLQNNVDSSNICEVLVLADMLQDNDMKTTAQEFVINHAAEVINSDSWKKFIKDKSDLAAEAMHLLCMRN